MRYIKQNFLYNRPFYNIETLNDEALAWLGRTANALPHAFTRKEPVTQWHIEQPFLRPHIPTRLPVAPSLQMAVRKDNTVSYKGNYYSLPLGSYKGRSTWVDGKIEEDYLIVTARPAADSQEDSKELCRHLIADGRGKKIINTDHKRDKTAAIDEMIVQVSSMLNDPGQGRKWLNAIRTNKPRYIRDQLLLIRKTIEEATDLILVGMAVTYCEENNIVSATDFKSALSRYQQHQQEQHLTTKIIGLNPLNGELPDAALNCPEKSAIQDYEIIITGKQVTKKRAKDNRD